MHLLWYACCVTCAVMHLLSGLQYDGSRLTGNKQGKGTGKGCMPPAQPTMNLQRCQPLGNSCTAVSPVRLNHSVPVLVVHAVFVCRPPEQQQQQPAEDGTAAWVVLSHLATVALLHYAAHQSATPKNLPRVVSALNLARGLLASSRVQQVREDSLRSQLSQQQQQHPQQPRQTLPQPRSSTCDSEESLSEGYQQDTMQWWMTGELLEQALELTSRFVQKFWVLLTGWEAAAAGSAPAAPLTAATLSAGGSSSSSSVPSGPNAPDGIFNSTQWVLFTLALELQRHAQELHVAELRARADSSQQGTQQHTSGSKAWAKHCLLLMRPVEALCRAVVSEPDMMSTTLPGLVFPLGAFLPSEGLLGKVCPAPFKELAGHQLFSLCCSFLKALAVSRSAAATSQAEDGARLDMVLSIICHAMTSAPQVSEVPTGLAGGPAAGGTCSDSGTCPDSKCPSSPDASSSSSSDSSSEAVSLLPWLVLLGRCCLHWALELQQPSTALRKLLHLETRVLLSAKLKRVLEACLVWLQDDSTAAELAAAGYDTRRVVAALQALTVPARAEDRSAAGSDGSEPAAAAAAAAIRESDVAALAQQLHTLGLALNTLAISCACNNPHCCNLEGLSELELVQGRARLCAKCRVARYCSKACQAQHWKLHKPACKALEAARSEQDGS